MPAQALKLDMRFLESTEDARRGGNILESVVRMAKWLGMSVIAEGVETREQADFLRSIGCSYVQGYLYARPMPSAEYEAFLREAGERRPERERAQIIPDAFSSGESLEKKREALLENLPCGAGIYEIQDGKIRATYLNRRYRAYLHRDIGDLNEAPIFDVVHPEDREKLRWAIQGILAQGRESAADIRIMDGKGDYIPFRIVGSAMEKNVERNAIYVTFTPISMEERTYAQMLPVALAAVIGASPDLAFVKDRDLRYVCCSGAFAQAAGLSDEREIVGKTDYDLLDVAYADRYRASDEELLRTGVARLNYEETLPTRDGSVRYASTSKYPLLDPGGGVIGIYGVSRDVTKARQTDSELELLTRSIPGGLATYACAPGGVRLQYFNDGFCAHFGFSRGAYDEEFARNPLRAVFEEDMPRLKAQLKALLETGTPMDLVYRAHVKGGGHKWISHKAVVAERTGEAVIVNAVLLDVTAQQEAVERLRISEEEHRLAVEHSGTILCRFSVKDNTVTLSPETAAKLRMPQRIRDVPYGPIQNGQISKDTASAYVAFYESILRGEETGVSVFRKMTAEGWRWFEAHFSTIFSGGSPVSAVISYIDVTERMERETVYKKWHQSLEEKDPAAYTLFRSNLNTDVSADVAEGSLLSFAFDPSVKRFNDRTAAYARQCVFEEDRARYIALLNSDALLANYYRGRRAHTLEYREIVPEGGVRWLRLTVELVEYPNSSDVGAYMMYENIDEDKRAELLTRERAETDALTGLLNRVTLAARTNALMEESSPGVCHALLMLDVDGFKQVNDVFGHGAGDRALIDISQALRGTLRRGDLLGRLGGDEFIVVLDDIPGDAAAADKAGRICDLVRKAFSAQVQISGSVGIALSPRDGTDFETLYRKADEALYHVKGTGKDNFAFYHSDMEAARIEPSAEPEAVRKRRALIAEDSSMNARAHGGGGNSPQTL